MRLKKLRLDKGKTQYEVALGCFGDEKHHSRLSAYENGREKPKVETINKILAFLGATWSDLEKVNLEQKLVMTFVEVCEALQISAEDLRRLVRLRKIQPVSFGTRPRFSVVEVNRFLSDEKGSTIHLYEKFPKNVKRGVKTPLLST